MPSGIADWYILKVSSMDKSVLHIKGAVLQLQYYQSCSVLFCVVLFSVFSYQTDCYVPLRDHRGKEDLKMKATITLYIDFQNFLTAQP